MDNLQDGKSSFVNFRKSKDHNVSIFEPPGGLDIVLIDGVRFVPVTERTSLPDAAGNYRIRFFLKKNERIKAYKHLFYNSSKQTRFEV